MSSFDETLLRLERSFNELTREMVPGTMLERVLLDNALCEEHGIKIRHPEKESQLVWCLAIGHMREPKKFFYGNTVSTVLGQAEVWLNRELWDKEHGHEAV
jgi:hypothetical protein